MVTKTPFFLLGRILLFLGILMIIPLLFATTAEIVPFILSAFITIGAGFLLTFILKPGTNRELTRRDAFILAPITWVFAGIFGSLPFLFAGTFSNPVDAIFETVSGFTTTGASVLVDIEKESKAILFWRSFTHWLGGMGIIVLGVAILPGLSVGGLQLVRLETAGMFSEKLKPRIIETARELWKVYILISLTEVFLLLLAGMPFFESILHMFGTVATGGFSPKNLSIGYYNNPWIHIIVIFFMFISGASFILHYRALNHRSLRIYIASTEFKVYLCIMLLFGLLASFNLFFSGYEKGFRSFLNGYFNVTSILTATGFANDDFDRWPSLARGIIFLTMFIGGCTGSTAGGIKVIRIVVFLKAGWMELRKLLFPHLVSPFRVGNQTLSEPVVLSTVGFVSLYLITLSIGVFLLWIMGVPLESAITAGAATQGGIGPGLGLVGPISNYSMIPLLGKIVLSILMILGRLEILTVLVLFQPAFWRK